MLEDIQQRAQTEIDSIGEELKRSYLEANPQGRSQIRMDMLKEATSVRKEETWDRERFIRSMSRIRALSHVELLQMVVGIENPVTSWIEKLRLDFGIKD